MLAAPTTRPGIQERRNSNNGIFVMRLHYSADLRKRDASWRETERAKGHTERGWRREYEIDWTAPEGEAVIPEFDAALHAKPCPVVVTRRLLRFWDFGYVSPVVLFAQLTDIGQLRVLRELCPFNTPLADLITMTKAVTLTLTGDAANVFDAGDPAAESQTDLGNAATVCKQAGILLHTNRPGTEVSYATLRGRFAPTLFVPREGFVPGVLIDPQGCPNLIEALAGAFHLSPDPPYRVTKTHPHKDLVDALRYGSDNLSASQGEWQQQLATMAANDIQELRGLRTWQPEPTLTSAAF